MPKFKITTLGCKVNQAESEAIAQDLLSSNWLMNRDGEQADVCIINTCTVTQKASMQSRQAIRQTVRAHPNARIVVTGCYARTSPQDIKKIEGVDEIVGQGDIQTIRRKLTTGGDEALNDNVCVSSHICPESRFELMPIAISSSRTRPFFKIQDGCDAFCTYCIVPHARGRSRSMPFEFVLDGIKRLANAGYREVVLTGVHLGVYGRDLIPASGLSKVLSRIRDTNPIERIRLSSIEPLELTGEILQHVAENSIFCRHFHIPLQSGDAGILAKMARPYSPLLFHDLVLRIHQLMPDAAIGVDTLVGFPGESETAFERTYDLIARLPVSYLHVFPFSSRPGTAAAKFPDKVSPRIIKNRCQRMRILGNEKRIKFYRRFVKRTLPLLIETKRDRSTGLLKGISSNYLPVLVDGGDELKNKIIDVEIKTLEGHKLYGNHVV
jgi:threonylcarbamoyladenosine tRNA methylthiotransferase MtaB